MNYITYLYIMPIQYRLLQNKIKGSKNYNKFYAHTVKRGVISMEEIEKTIESNCTAKSSDVRLVLRELFDTVKHYMQEGYVVDLREMGKFSISVKSTCVDNPKDFRLDKNITGFKCNYTPDGRRSNVGADGVGPKVERGFFDGCKAVEVKA